MSVTHPEIFWTLITGTAALLLLAVVFVVTLVFNQKRFITIERQKLNSLEEREQRFRSLIENSFDVIALLSENGNITFASQSAYRVLGYTSEEFMQLSPDEFIGREDFRRLTHSFSGRPADSGRRVNFQFRARHKNGSLRWLEGVATNLLSEPAVNAVVVNFRDITERKDAEEHIKSSRDQLRKLSARLQAAREEERTRIAREVHDELGQMLTVLKMDLTLLERKLDSYTDAVEDIHAMYSLVDAVIQSVRRIATELRPEILDDLGIIDAFESELEAFESRTGIQATFVSNIKELAVEREHKTALFRIFQEALTNIARHARASKISVHVEQREGGLIIEIFDNGRGIRNDEISGTKSLGLLGMKERALMMGGEIHISGEGGKGTLVQVRVPLAQSIA